MKKILLFSLVILICCRCFAQTASLTVTNNAPSGCDINVIMYASGTYVVPALCDQYVGNTFTVAGGGTTVIWCDPLDFQMNYCSGPTVDWASSPAGDFSSTPSDFQWDAAFITYSGSGCPSSMCTSTYSDTVHLKNTCVSGCPNSIPGTHTWGCSSSTPPFANFSPACGMVFTLADVVIVTY